MSSIVELQEQKTKEAQDQAIPVTAVASAPEPAPVPSASVSSFSGSASSPAQLTLLLARLHQYDLLNAAYRNYLSTHLESGQVWYLLSLSLLSASRLDESFLAIRECLTRCEKDVPALALASQISLRLRKGKESVEYASRAMRGCKAEAAARAAQAALEAQLLSADVDSPTTLNSIAAGLEANKPRESTHSFRSLSRHPNIQSSLLQTCQLLFGVSCSRYAYAVSTFSNRKSLQKRALYALESAYKQQSQQHATTGIVSNKNLVFALACLYADIREIPRAISLTKRALELDRTNVHHWNLLALLLSSQKKYRSALACCTQGLALVPSGSIGPLLLTRAKLESHLSLHADATATVAELARICFTDEVHMRSYVPSTGGPSMTRPTFRPERKAENTERVDNARVDRKLDSNTNEEEFDRLELQVDALLMIASVYALQYTGSSNDHWLDDAFDAVHFARERAPTHMLPEVHVALAALATRAGAANQAGRHYESALALDAHHTAALLGLARIETQKSAGNLVLAYGYLMSALQVDATNHHAWYEMGLILQAQGKSSAAAEHFITALELEKSAPIESFQNIPRIVA